MESPQANSLASQDTELIQGTQCDQLYLERLWSFDTAAQVYLCSWTEARKPSH